MAKKAIRPIRIEGNVAYVPLTQGYEAIIDAADVPLVEGANWYADRGRHTFYARRNGPKVGGKQSVVKLHRVILPGGEMVDHINGNGLDNRRVNLRLADRTENRRNCRASVRCASGFKGVSLHRASGRWVAQIGVGGKKIYLGLYDSPELAALAYARASAKMHGEFGRIA